MENVQNEFIGEGREFLIELDSFDDDAWTIEIITGFTWFFLEDDEADMEMILEEIKKQLSDISVDIDEVIALNWDEGA